MFFPVTMVVTLPRGSLSYSRRASCICTRAKSLQSCLTLCDPWTVAGQAPLSMGFSRQEYCSGLPCPPPGGLPDPGIMVSPPPTRCLSDKSLSSPRVISGRGSVCPLLPHGALPPARVTVFSLLILSSHYPRLHPGFGVSFSSAELKGEGWEKR